VPPVNRPVALRMVVAAADYARERLPAEAQAVAEAMAEAQAAGARSAARRSPS